MGNIYSRVGTPDWVSDQCTKEKFEERVEDILNTLCFWGSKRAIQQAKNKLKRDEPDRYKSEQIEVNEFIAVVKDFEEQARSKKKKAVNVVIATAESALPSLEEIDLVKFKKILLNNPDLSSLF